jgi:hypothetical protein
LQQIHGRGKDRLYRRRGAETPERVFEMFGEEKEKRAARRERRLALFVGATVL